MKRLLLPLLVVFMTTSWLAAQINETFESGTATLNWEALDGTWNGVVNNPSPNFVNNSSKVGRYVKKDSTQYSLFWAKFATPISLATNNKFKINVFSKKAGTLIFKLQGPLGAKEVAKPIVVTGAWQEYNLDFSSAKTIDSLNRLILFFDAGVGNSKQDTFWFDNIQQLAPDACAGVVANPQIFDDFECQRNANYLNGWDSLSVVNNPNPSGINTSAKVGRYGDPVPEPWAAIVNNNPNGFDLKTYNYMRVKVWAAKAGTLLLKLEDGGTAAAVEKPVTIAATDLNKWIEVGADFSAQAFNSYKKATMFFNAGVDAVAGDVYYFDDWRMTEKPAIEDFDPTPKMVWNPSGNNAALNGTYTGSVANPLPNSVNSTALVGKYAKGSAAFSALTGALPTGFIIDSLSPQLNLMVLAPAGSAGKKVQLQLVSGAQGNKTADATIDSAGVWNELKFDFTAAKGITDISSINVLFNTGTAEQGVIYYFDQLRLSKLTLNPCVGVVPIPNILDDFECQRNGTYGAGADILTVISNPFPSATNTSQNVGRYADPLDPWSALVLTKTTAIDLSKYNQLSMKVYAPRANTPILFKLEGGTSPGKEIWDTIRTANTWTTFQIDFSSVKANNYKNISLFFNGGVDHTTNDVYYLDDIQWKSEPITGCALDFETTLTSAQFKYFGADTLTDKFTTVVANPSKTGINLSNQVAQFNRLTKGETWQGAYADLPAPMKWTGNVIIKAKVLMDHIGLFAIKLEGSPSGNNGFENKVANTKTGQWEELTFDFTGKGTPAISGKEGYNRLTVFFDLGLDLPTAIKTSYLDDIVIGTGSCGTTGIFDPAVVEKMEVFPNPTNGELTIRNTTNIRRIEVTNMLGQHVQVYNLSSTYDNMSISIDGLDKGMYIISGFGERGIIATTKVIKN